MNKKIALILSLLLGVAAAALMFSYIQKTTEAKTKGWDMQTVLVASADLPAGTVLSQDNTASRPYPSKYISGRVLTPDSAEIIIGGILNFVQVTRFGYYYSEYYYHGYARYRSDYYSSYYSQDRKDKKAAGKSIKV